MYSWDEQCFWGNQCRLHSPVVIHALRNVGYNSVTAEKGNMYLFCYWSPAAHRITLTFSAFLCFDCLLPNAPHFSKVNEAKQETNKKVRQWNADLLTKAPDCTSDAELQYHQSSTADTMLKQTHTPLSFRKSCCAWGIEVTLCLKFKKMNQCYYTPSAKVPISA